MLFAAVEVRVGLREIGFTSPHCPGPIYAVDASEALIGEVTPTSCMSARESLV